MSEKLKAFYLPQHTHDAIYSAAARDPELKPSELIERALDFYRKMHAGGHDVAKYYEDNSEFTTNHDKEMEE